MIYNEYGIKVYSDFQIKKVKEFEKDIDILVMLGYKCLNLHLDNSISPLNSRLQFPTIRSILIRLCKEEDNTLSTIHFLGDSDLHSAVVNFEIDYREYDIEIIDEENYVDMKLVKRG